MVTDRGARVWPAPTSEPHQLVAGQWARAVADGLLAFGALASRIVFHVDVFKAQWPDRRHLCDVLS